MASPFDDNDALMNAMQGAPAASLEASQGETVAGQTQHGQSSMVPADAGAAGAGAAGAAAPSAASAAAGEIKKAEPEVPKGPTPYSLWEAKHLEVLAERQGKANESKKALIAQGKEEIAKFYAARNDRIASAKKQNRLDEAAAKREASNVREYGLQWDKITRLLNTTPKANEKRSVERFRKLLLSLKNDDPKKPAGSSGGASGAAAAAAAGGDVKSK